MQRSDFRCFHRLRVRWAEVDMQKIVFNAHYLMYVDTAMSEYWRALALPYEASMLALGGEMYVKKATVEYHASARLDDTLDVGLKCARIGNSSCLFTAGIFCGDRLLISAELVYVFADPATQTSRPVPAPLRALIEAYESGQPVTQVQTGDWATLQQPASSVRTAVFVEEQGIAREDEWDAADATAVHAVVTNLLGMPVATGRLLRDGAANSGSARIGRMAVDRTLRGSGVGRQVIDALEQAARARGDQRVVLSAQRSAEGFYQRLGYQPVGEPYDEVGIAHIGMARLL